MSNLFQTVLGVDAFARLPRTVQRLHADRGARRYAGHGEVERGAHPLARLCCAAARLPEPFVGAMAVDMQSSATEERWVRRFGLHAMPSRLRLQEGRVSERLGLLHFAFSLQVGEAVAPVAAAVADARSEGVGAERDAGTVLQWRVRQVRVLGIALPPRWFDGVVAREFERDGRYRYDVSARLPRIGLLVHYRGWLDVDAPERLA